MAKAQVDSKCSICQRHIDAIEDVVILSKANLSAEPIGRLPLKKGKKRVIYHGGKKLVWCKECAQAAFEKVMPMKEVD